MKHWITIFCLFLSLQIAGQEVNKELEFQVIKETLPQVLAENPNSLASYLKGGGWYKILYPIASDMPDSIQAKNELDFIADSVSKVLEKHKIRVLLSDTLYTYTYSPTYYYNNFGDGWFDTFDLKNSDTWQITNESLIKTFQTDYEFRGLSIPIDLEFIDLIKAHINSTSNENIPIDLSQLNSSYYTFINIRPENHDSLHNQRLLMNGIRLYKPVFNKTLDKACYLFSFQALNGPWREFVFIEKRNGKWYLLETYGSKHVDRNEDWYK